MAARKPKAVAPSEPTAVGAEELSMSLGSGLPAETVASDLQAINYTTNAEAPAAEAENPEDNAMQNSIQNGADIEYTPAADVAGGDLVVFPAMVAVAVTDIPSGGTGTLSTEGVFDLKKDATAFSQGQAVYAKGDGAVTATSDSNTVPAGKCWAAAAGGDATVAVKINA